MVKYVYNFSTETLDIINTASDFYNDFLKLDQTTPQTISNGQPNFGMGWTSAGACNFTTAGTSKLQSTGVDRIDLYNQQLMNGNWNVLMLDQSTPQTVTGLTDGFLKLTSGVLGTGTVDLSAYVPYTGATGAVDLGVQNLTTTGQGTFGKIRANDKIFFTQDDENEYIDSLADGYMDYQATTAHRFGVDTTAGFETKLTISNPTGNTGGIGIETIADPYRYLHSYSSNIWTVPAFYLQQNGTGDAGFEIGAGTVSYVLGVDNSDSDAFKISYSATKGSAILGINDKLTLSTAGVLRLPADNQKIMIGAESAAEANLEIWHDGTYSNILGGYSGTGTRFGRTSTTEFLEMRNSQWYARIGNSWAYDLTSTTFSPYTDSNGDLGTSSKEWGQLFVDEIAYIDEIRQNDNESHYWGTANDFRIYFNGTNAIINPKAVGSGYLNVQGQILVDDKIMFTQTDGNEYIDSLADGYLDIGATTQIRFNNDISILINGKKIILGEDSNATLQFDGSALRVDAPELFLDDTPIRTSGQVTMSANNNIFVIPTSDPGISGAIWNNAGVLSISAGA
jgi:hypothetical protein